MLARPFAPPPPEAPRAEFSPTRSRKPPAWASVAPRPWKSLEDVHDLSQSLPLAEQTLPPNVALHQSIPIDVHVPADGEWHRLPEMIENQGTRAFEKATGPSSVSSRRATRKARDNRKIMAQKTAEQVAEERAAVADAGSDALWTARKERIRALLADERASDSDLKRELRKLLGYADASRNAARHERAELARELQAMLAPLLGEIRRLKGELAKTKGAQKEVAPPMQEAIEGLDSAEDVLRAGKGGGGEAAEAITSSAPAPAKPPPPMTAVAKSKGGGSDGAASVAGAISGVAQTGMELSRRDRQQVARQVEAAASALASTGSVEALLECLHAGPYAAQAACGATEHQIVLLASDAHLLKQQLTAAKVEAALLQMLSDGERQPSTLHKAVLNVLERMCEGHRVGGGALMKAGGASRLVALLGAWSKGHIAAGQKQRERLEKTAAAAGGDAPPADPPPVEAPTGAAALLPHLLLLISALCLASDDARTALSRAGLTDGLMSLLDGPMPSEATILACDALRALGVSRLLEVVDETPREATVEMIDALADDARASHTPISTERRDATLAAAADARHRAQAASRAAAAAEEGGGLRGKLAARRRRAAEGVAASGVAPAGAPSAVAMGGDPSADASGGIARPPLDGLVRVASGEDAETLVLRCRADSCRRPLTAEEKLNIFCTSRASVKCFVTVALEVRWGALVEVGRSEARYEESAQSIWWEEMRLEIPEGTPERVYLRFAVYEAAHRGTKGKPRLIATVGATVHQIAHAMHDDRRGVALALRSLGSAKGGVDVLAGKPCGTLWVERCELLGLPPPPPPAAAPAAAPPLATAVPAVPAALAPAAAEGEAVRPRRRRGEMLAATE